ncbi:MAG TPA: YdeI/OmpD-associated family protein [Ignavibacteriaceae bacterium]|nr:YdeI/OmpD-associated family protein [Ignavibacteriaceae bacterium]
MGKINPDAGNLIEQYIEDTPEFAQPICKKIRSIILSTDERIVEDWKWGPNYNYKGMLCGFGAFKKHVHLSFYNGDRIKDKYKIFVHGEANAHNRGIKFFSFDDINEKAITDYVKQSMMINEAEVKPEKKVVEIPEELKKVLAKHKDAKAVFDKLAFTHQKEYALWIKEAKKEETKERRLNKTIEMLLEGKKLS